MVEHPQVFDHAGILFNEPPGKTGVPLSSHPTTSAHILAGFACAFTQAISAVSIVALGGGPNSKEIISIPQMIFPRSHVDFRFGLDRDRSNAVASVAAVALRPSPPAVPQLVLSEITVPEPPKISHEIGCATWPRTRGFPYRHGRDRNDGLFDSPLGQVPSRCRTPDGTLFARAHPGLVIRWPQAYAASWWGRAPGNRRAGARPWRTSTADATRPGVSTASDHTGPGWVGRSVRRP